jgi:predicted nucleotidyltransferase
MLDTIIASKARAAILKFFFLNEDKKFHIREISRRLNINVNQARTELIKLTNIGLLKHEKTGNIHIYYVNKDSIVYGEFSSIIKKTAGFEKALEMELKPIKNIQFAFIFGSLAEGNLGPSSDIDLMIIGTPDIFQLNEAINKTELIIERSIQYIVYPLAEFKKKRNHGFIKNVMKKKKIFLIGEPDAIE